jgi:uncharacterized protein (DUF1501 family)
MFSRRDFLRANLGSSTLIALTPTVPTFLAHAARAAAPRRDSRLLVVIELNGGNDGINTVVPFKDEGYAKYRTALRIPAHELHKVTPEVGLHPAMGDAARLLEEGRLAIVQGVGYPNPNRSHFTSMAIWHTANVRLKSASNDTESNAAFGWIGQALDEGRQPTNSSPGAQFIGDGATPMALRGRRSAAAAIARPEEAMLVLKGCAQSAAGDDIGVGELAGFVRRSALDAYATSERMAQVLRAEDKGARYPATGLAGQLRLIARLIKGGGDACVFYVAQGSYDTHAAQLAAHATLLKELSEALKAFLDDLAAAQLADRVLVLCFSEFGRRVAENGSGTDHGTAGPVFLAGPMMKPGLVGNAPKLLDLQDGDLTMSVDFRRVYATVLEDWLGLPSKLSLGGEFAKLPLFRA